MEKTSVYFMDIDEAWDKKVLSQKNFDIYHLSGWINASTTIDQGEPKGVVAEYKGKEVLLPLMVRQIDCNYWDGTSTYGYGGPLDDDALTHEELDLMLEAIQAFLFEEGCVSLFMRLHPIINDDRAPTVGKMVEHGLTLSSDLTKTEEEHWKETQNQHRRGIRKALREGVTTKIEALNEENAKVFSEIYNETMSTVGATDYYFFDNDYYYNLSKNLQGRLLLITAYLDDKAIASSLYTVCQEPGIIQYHLGGTLNDYRKLQPAKLITHVIREWGRQNNYKLLHLGGGVGAKLDSLYHYKKGFSSQEQTFKTYRLVVNPEKYAELVETVGISGEDLNSEFFPLYRMKAPVINEDEAAVEETTESRAEDPVNRIA